MKIAAVVVTCNRIVLLPRALKSIEKQRQPPDVVYVVSNSSEAYLDREQAICESFGFIWLRNNRTNNYAGALNKAVERIVVEQGINKDLYFASLDDDDEWMPDYLWELKENNSGQFDLLVGQLFRTSITESNLLSLPEQLSAKDFLIGNPGISGSNTFVKLKTLLEAGGFDEGLPATIDRDFLVRLFLLKPSYRIIRKHLVTQHTDEDRERVTINREQKNRSLQIFFYKYSPLMGTEERAAFFKRAEELFSVSRETFEYNEQEEPSFSIGRMTFKNKGNYQLVIGFIAGDEYYAERILTQLMAQEVPADLIVVINNTKVGKLRGSEQLLKGKIDYRFIHPSEWKRHLRDSRYGEAFTGATEINSIPLGRTILHYHLYEASQSLSRPVYWIIDDDVTLNFVTLTKQEDSNFDLSDIINQYQNEVDAVIGSVSNDPPLPFLSSIRCQLVDFLHSHWADNKVDWDYLGLKHKPDYYYDLSDRLSIHLEIPIYYSSANQEALTSIFSGKGVSRKVIQRPELKGIERTITQRGPNTLVFNPDLLSRYPVVNLNVDEKFARRGDLLWVLLNQLISNHTIIEHTYSVQQHRIVQPFSFRRELEKSAYDIIGYAFNKGFVRTIDAIKSERKIAEPEILLEQLQKAVYSDMFFKTYLKFLGRRRVKFLMNYHRIVGLLKILAADFKEAEHLYEKMSGLEKLAPFEQLLANASGKGEVDKFIKDLAPAIKSYSKILDFGLSSRDRYVALIKEGFDIKAPLKCLGTGNEGIVLTDTKWVYKVFLDISDAEWQFLKAKSSCFSQCNWLEPICLFELNSHRVIRYPFVHFTKLKRIDKPSLIQFMQFAKAHDFVFTNIAPKNFIQTQQGGIKLIDYGKSFEKFTQKKFINAVKRAFLLYRYPTLEDRSFKKIVAEINLGNIPEEIQGWEVFYNTVIG